MDFTMRFDIKGIEFVISLVAHRDELSFHVAVIRKTKD